MITLRYPGFPLNGELQWERVECVYVPGQTLDVYLGIGAELIERLVINGAVIEPSDVGLCTPNDGDEISVVPVVGGSNRGLVVGILGAIVAIAAVYFTGGLAASFLAPYLGGSYAAIGLTGFAVASLIYNLAHPARSATGDKTGNTYTFDGITNEDREGVAQPVVLGDDLTGGVRVDSFVRIGMFPDPDNPSVTKKGARSYQLINVSKARHGIQEISGVRANNEPITNFHGASYAYTLGETPEQWYNQAGAPIARPEAFNVSANTFTQNVELTTTPYVYSTSATSNVDAIELLIAFPSGLFHTHNGADKGNNQTIYSVEYKLHSASEWIPFGGPGFNVTDDDLPVGRSVVDSNHSPFTEVVRIDKLTPGRYDVRLTWISSLWTDPANDGWKAFLVGVTEEIGDAPEQPGYALLAVYALAIEQLNGAPPVISCRCKGIKVPWWDGSSWQAPTWYGPDPDVPIGRNPAWLILEAHRDGNDADSTYPAWGRRLPDEKIYLPHWKAFADKCATLKHVVDDQGAEWDEPAHQLDYTLNEQRPWDAWIRDMLGTARAAPMMAGNGSQHGVFYDDAADAVQLVTMGNMAAGSFQPTYDFSPRTNTFDVTFRDRDNDFATVTRSIENQHLTVTLGKVPRRESISMVGSTRSSQIARDVFYNLKKHESAKVPLQFAVRTDAILWKVGDVINVQHDQPGWGIAGGRVRLDEASLSNTTTRVILPIRAHVASGSVYAIDTDGTDILVDLGTRSYEVRVRLADGSGEEGQRRDVSAVSVSPAGWLVATTTTPFSSTPKYQDPCAFGEYQKSVKPYRCLAITKSANAFRNITCIDYNASVYSSSGTLETINYSSLPAYGGPPPPIPSGSCVAFEDLAVQNTNVDLSDVVVQWGLPVRTPGYGFYGGADIEVSFDDGATYKFLDHVPGIEYRWRAAPHEVALVFRVTPVSTAGRQNLSGRAVSAAITCHGSQAIPANVAGLTLTRSGDAVLAAWTDISREMQYEIRTSNANWGDPAHPPLFSGRATQYRIVGPASRSITLWIKAFTPFAKYSATATSSTITIPAPAPPSVGTISKTDNWLKIAVGGSSQEGVRAIYMWASKTNAFTPSDATRVSMTVGPAGGEFTFQTTDTATWFFRVACADAISDRLNAAGTPDFSYSGQFNTALVVITPQLPTGVTFAANPALQHRRAVTAPTSGPPTTAKIFSLFVNWTFSDTVNAAGTLVGFQVIVYLASGGDPNAPYWDSGILASVSQRSCGIDGLTVETSANYLAAVRSVYIDGNNLTRSSYVTSSGLTLDPGTADDPIAQLKFDPTNGGYYSVDVTRFVDAAGNVIEVNQNGVSTTTANGMRRSPRRVIRSFLRGAVNGQFVTFGDSNLDPPLYAIGELPPSSKLHIVAQSRAGQTLGIQPLYYPVRNITGVYDITSLGFRVILSQQEGLSLSVTRDTAPFPGGWTNSAIHGSIMQFTNGVLTDGTNNVGKWAWYDFTAVKASNGLPLSDVLWIAADMPAVYKPDGSPYYVDMHFSFNRPPGLTWSGTYASAASAGTGTEGELFLRAMTDGRRWRTPLAWSPDSRGCYICQWYVLSFESSDPLIRTACTPTRVLLDAAESHNVPFVSGSSRIAGATTAQDVDIFLVEDF